MVLPSPYWLHTAFEVAGYATGMQLFLRHREHWRAPALRDAEQRLWLVVAAALGAALGSKLSYWIDDPAAAFAGFPDARNLLQGKSIVGGLLGGLLAIEACKRALGQRASTGDAFVLPLAAGMAIGRLGCFSAGLADHTYGNPTHLPWGVDFGDGVARHPTQLYEVVFLAAWTAWLLLPRRAGIVDGDRFKAFLAGYLLFRLAVDAIKPIHWVYPPGLSGLQWLCLAGLTYYARHLPRLSREFLWATR